MAGPTHPFRFGVMVSAATSGRQWADLARQVEDLGYSTLCVPDHFIDQIAPTPALTAAACATTRLRVCSLVYGVDFRHLAVLAKDATTLDLLSDGRFEFGLGAGWLTEDYRNPGFRFDGHGTRIDRTVEAVGILKRLFAGETVTTDGPEFHFTDYVNRPAPLQPGGPPILMGGGGRKILSAAARLADIVSVNPAIPQGAFGPQAWATVAEAATEEKIGWLREAAGPERFEQLEICFLNFRGYVGDNPAGAAEEFSEAVGLGPEAVLASPNFMVGTVASLIDKLQGQRERWQSSYYIVRGDLFEAFAPVVATLAGT